MRIMKISVYLIAILIMPMLASAQDQSTLKKLAKPTGVKENKAPSWIKHGAYVYRFSCTDDPDMLVPAEQGIGLMSNLLDGSVEQIPLMTGMIGDDHRGNFIWDGIWPYWNHVSFRGKNWQYLHDFMKRVQEKHNTKVSFHLNLTDVNIGLREYPETRAFFKKLVETKSIYRRDWNYQTNKRDKESPYVPQEIDKYITDKDKKNPDPIQIFALVNYQNFWKSGLAKEMIDEFYSHLPYAPPVLYLDVLNLSGGNFSTGYPDGPLGGSKETQRQGILAIAKYLRSKGTEIGTEGDRDFMEDYGTYGWLHCGVSKPDYSKIQGASKGAKLVLQHVYGNTGGFCLSPIASTQEQLKKARAHYRHLLKGAPITRKMPGLDTWHLADRSAQNNEFNQFPDGNMGGDPFRGDWIDLINHFYLTGIQELYHIGKGNYRVSSFDKIGVVHVNKFVLEDERGESIVLECKDSLPPEFPEWGLKSVMESGFVMLEGRLIKKFNVSKAGKYKVKFFGRNGGREHGGVNFYIDNKLEFSKTNIPFPKGVDFVEMGEVFLSKGEHVFSCDSGAIYVEWNDGTVAIWDTPSMGKGFKVTNGDVTFADDYDRMWPDTWSGEKKIYFYSWDGTNRRWKLPQDWAKVKNATLYPLTPEGRGKGIPMSVKERSINPKLLPQVPYILLPKSL